MSGSIGCPVFGSYLPGYFFPVSGLKGCFDSGSLAEGELVDGSLGIPVLGIVSVRGDKSLGLGRQACSCQDQTFLGRSCLKDRLAPCLGVDWNWLARCRVNWSARVRVELVLADFACGRIDWLATLWIELSWKKCVSLGSIGFFVSLSIGYCSPVSGSIGLPVCGS